MKVILLRYGELFLKGQNRKVFENALVNNIKNKLNGFNYTFLKTQGRFVVKDVDENCLYDVVEKLKCVFGLVSLSIAEEVDADPDAIRGYVKNLKLKAKSFKVDVKRADKKFPISSMEFAKELGGIILENTQGIVVDLYNPEAEVCVDIRFNGKAYIYSDIEMPEQK